MRIRILGFLVTTLLAALTASPALAQGSGADAAQQVLAQVRQAAGGEKLAALQSLSVEGKVKRQVRMNRGGEAQTMTRESELQMDFMMPDKFLRRETSEMMMGGGGFITAVTGFNGNGLIQDFEGSSEINMQLGMMQQSRIVPGVGRPDPAEVVKRLQADFARSWLAWALASPASSGLQFRHAGVQDGADVIEVTGGEMPATQFFFDQQSRRLSRMTYKAPAPRQMMGFGGPGGGTPSAAQAPPEDVEWQIDYSDFKMVDGVTLPHRLRRSMNGEVMEETEIKKFKLNPNLKPDKFKPRTPSNQ